jgi:hypothetical protein
LAIRIKRADQKRLSGTRPFTAECARFGEGGVEAAQLPEH